MMPALTRLAQFKVGLVFAGVFLGIAILGRNGVVQAKQRQLTRLEQQYQDELAKADVLPLIVEHEHTIAAFRKRLAPTRNIDALIETVNAMAIASGIELTSVVPGQVRAFGEYLLLPVEVEVQCEYHELGHFLSRLESAEQFIKVEALHVEDVRDLGRVGEGHSVNLLLSTLFWEA